MRRQKKVTKKPRKNPIMWHGAPVAYAIENARPGYGLDGPGVYFTNVKAEAAKYAQKPVSGHSTPTVHRVRIDLANPLYVHRMYPTGYGYTKQEAKKLQYPPRLLAKIEEAFALEPVGRAIAALQALGYDGIISYVARRPSDLTPRQLAKIKTHYVVFDPTIARALR